TAISPNNGPLSTVGKLLAIGQFRSPSASKFWFSAGEESVDRSQLISSARSNLAGLGRGQLGVPLLLLVMMAMMMLPMPPFLLDVFFTFNIALSIVVLLVCVYALRPLDFSVFPTILLVATLLRLALNVASTRVVMLHGQDG